MLLVFGVHRSGTSTVARLMECLGATPSKRLLPGNESNRKGFFEDLDVVRFNQNRLLKALGMTWHHTAPPDWGRLTVDDRSILMEEAVGLIHRNFIPENPVSVLKDPVVTILLPFWVDALEKAGYSAKPVGVVRDPFSVARSLQARDGFSIRHGLALYTSNWLTAFSWLKESKASFVSYDRVVTDPRPTLIRLSGELRLPFPADFEDRLQDFMTGFLDPGLRHHRPSIVEARNGWDGLPAASDVYSALLSAAEGWESVEEALKGLRRWEGWLSSSASLLGEFDRLAILNRRLMTRLLESNRMLAGLGIGRSEPETGNGSTQDTGWEPSLEEAAVNESPIERAHRIITESGLFDGSFYLKNNPDVLESGIDPLMHYLMHGCREGRNPSAWFSTNRYLNEHMENEPTMWNPLLHFIENGGDAVRR